jgi:ABC-type nitrate/sulfonate/bicarbonate transport system permease component
VDGSRDGGSAGRLREAAGRALGQALGHGGLVVAVLLAWELASRSPWVNPFVFPPVSVILARWVGFVASGAVLAPLGTTLGRALAGLAAAVLAGVPLGLWMGRSRWAAWWFEPLFAFGFPLPKIALVPLYTHWFGLFSFSKIMLVFTDCLFPIVVFTYHGARGVSPIYLWSARARGTRGPRLLWRVVLPLALAHAYDGFQVALVVSLLVAVVSEMVSGGGGLGVVMISAYRYADVPTAFASLATISLAGLLLGRAAQAGRARLLHWHTGEA